MADEDEATADELMVAYRTRLGLLERDHGPHRVRLGELADGGHDLVAPLVVDRMRRAELARERQPMLVDVDRNDGIAAA